MELVQDLRMRQYELTYLLPEDLTVAESAQTKKAIEDLLKKHSITIVSQDDWGRKELAYPIKYKSKKQHEANYTHLVVKAEALNVPKFEKELYLNQDVIRHLIILADQKVAIKAKE